MASHYLAIDIETTGPGVHRHRMVALGAALVDASDGRVDADFRAMLSLGDHTNGRPDDWDERTYVEFWTNASKRADGATPLAALQAIVAKDGTETEADAMRRFAAWLREQFARHPQTLIVVDTVSFDTTFVNAALDRHTDIANLVEVCGKYRPVRDVSSFYVGVGRKTPRHGFFGSREAAIDALGLDATCLPTASTHDHDPRNDATFIARTFAAICNAVDAQEKAKRARVAE